MVVGGGPGGAACAYWLARAGHDVVVCEKKAFPREKTCGDGLTPRAVYQLGEMGLADRLTDYHRYEGLRACAHGITLEMQWPDHPRFPQHGYVVRRRDLDRFVADHAVGAGARVLQHTEVTGPVLRDGIIDAVAVRDTETGETGEIAARFVVVADGANSRFGRALGTQRDRSYPQGMALRGYYESPLHDDPWIESALDLVDRQGNSLPGLRMDLPRRRRHHQRRRRAALHLPGLQVGQHLAPARRVRRHRPRLLGDRPRPPGR